QRGGRAAGGGGRGGGPGGAEEVMGARDIALAELTGGRLHVAHVSTARAVALIREARSRGVRVSAEATPHHLMLTEEAVGDYDASAKMAPPLRTAAHVARARTRRAPRPSRAMATRTAPRHHDEHDPAP